MARPSKNTDLKLIEVGRALLPKTGVSGLSLRQVAEEANVNLGMFHYHFGSKDEFVRQVLQQVYEELFVRIEREFQEGANRKNPLERLRGMIRVLARFAYENSELLASVVRDILAGEKTVKEFVLRNFPRHIALIFETATECQKRGAIRDDLSVPQLIFLCASSLFASSVMPAIMNRLDPDLLKEALRTEFFTEGMVEARVDFIMKGLKP